MKASRSNPIYTVYLIRGNTKYDLTPVLISLELSDPEKQMAQTADISLMNVQVAGTWLTGLIQPRDRVYIYADDGEKQDEVFRGFAWSRPYHSSLTDREIVLKCYDHLVYFQESDDAEYFTAGKSSKDVISTFCSKWGVPLDYSYESITHSKLALRGNLWNIFTSDVLDLVKERTGEKYVIRSEKDVMRVMKTGQNATVYAFKARENGVSTRSGWTMDDMTTKVVILGKADKDDRQKVEATISGNTGQYGTLQKIITRSENTALADAKKEAQTIIDESGTPTWEYEVKAPDIPWIRKGDKVYLNAGDIANQYLIVTSVDHSISNKEKTITMTLRKPSTAKASASVATSTGSTSSQKSGNTSNTTTNNSQTSTAATFTLTIKNAGDKAKWGKIFLYVNGVLRQTTTGQDVTATLNYKDYVKIMPAGSYTITESSFNMKDNKTVTITWS